MDVIHVIEKLWTAGECFLAEGSKPLNEWIDARKDRLYGGKVDDIIAELRQHLHAIPRTGPGTKGKRERLLGVIRYLDKRVSKMPYDKIIELDVELGAGSVEGAVRTSSASGASTAACVGSRSASRRSCSYAASRPMTTGSASSRSCTTECTRQRNATAYDNGCNPRHLPCCRQFARRHDMGRSAPIANAGEPPLPTYVDPSPSIFDG